MDVSIADSIFHTGDTDTSIRFPGTDHFHLKLLVAKHSCRFKWSVVDSDDLKYHPNIDGIGYANLLQVQGGATGEGVSVGTLLILLESMKMSQLILN